MTRINLIPPSLLSPKHLVSEYRELPRVFGLVRRAQAKNKGPRDCEIPETFRLGTGHVKFFYDKLRFLEFRYTEIISVMQDRGYTTNWKELPSSGIGWHWFNGYLPTPEAIQISLQRLRERDTTGEYYR